MCRYDVILCLRCLLTLCFSTCASAADPRLNDFRFRYVLIDEATQACEPEALIPLTKGCKMAVLIGDHSQLGPVQSYGCVPQVFTPPLHSATVKMET